MPCYKLAGRCTHKQQTAQCECITIFMNNHCFIFTLNTHYHCWTAPINMQTDLQISDLLHCDTNFPFHSILLCHSTTVMLVDNSDENKILIDIQFANGYCVKMAFSGIAK